MLKLRIFVLDDNQERIDYFTKQFDNHDLIIHYKINKQTYNILKEEKFDILFLDHDLENHHSVSPEKNGQTIALFLTQNKLQQHAIIYIHSMNPVGANNMVKIFNNAGYEVQWIPYHLLKQCGGINEKT